MLWPGGPPRGRHQRYVQLHHEVATRARVIARARVMATVMAHAKARIMAKVGARVGARLCQLG